MKKLLTSTACILALASWNALAVEEHHPEKDPATKVAAPDTGKTVQKMQDNMKKMQGQLDRIAKTKDAKERQKLLQEHMQTMQENMMAGKSMTGGKAGGMMDCPMMKDGMKDGMMGGGSMMGGPGGGAGMPPEAMMNRMQTMEKRMDMMQMMMEQMRSQPAPTTK